MADKQVKYKASLDARDFNAGVREASKEFDKFVTGVGQKAGSLGSVMQAMGPAGQAAAAAVGMMTAGATATAAALAAATAKAVEYGGSIADMATKTGASAEALQRLQYGASLAGVSIDSMSGALIGMEKQLVKAPENFAKLGLEADKLIKMKPEDALLKVADALQDIEDPAVRTAAAIATLGKAGAEALPALMSDLEGAGTKAEQLGLVLSEQTIAALDETGDAWDTMTQAMDGFLLNVGAAIGSTPGLADAIMSVADAFGELNRFVQDNSDLLQSLLSAGLAPIPDIAHAAADGLQTMASGLINLATAARDYISTSPNLQTALLAAGAIPGIGPMLGGAAGLAGAISGYGAQPMYRGYVSARAPFRPDFGGNPPPRRPGHTYGDLLPWVGPQWDPMYDRLRGDSPYIVDSAAGGTTQLSARYGSSNPYIVDTVAGDLEGAIAGDELRIKAELAREAWADLAQTMNGVGQVVGGINDMMGALGISAESTAGRIGSALGAALGGLEGVFANLASGNVLGAIGSGLSGLAGIVGSLFGGGGEKAGQQKDKARADKDVGYQLALHEKEAAAAESAQEKLNAAMEKYGLTAADMGTAFHQANLDEQAMGLLESYELLTAAGADVGTVNEAMAADFNAYVNEAIGAGATIPAAMQPIIDQLIANGQLLDENGVAYESAEAAGITYAQTMTEAISSMVDAIQMLVDAINGVPTSKTVNFDITTSGGDGIIDGDGTTTTGDGILDSGGGGHHIEAFANGGIVTRPTLALIGEAGPEAVVPLTGGGAGAGMGGTVIMNLTLPGVRDARTFVLELEAAHRSGILKPALSRVGVLA